VGAKSNLMDGRTLAQMNKPIWAYKTLSPLQTNKTLANPKSVSLLPQSQSREEIELHSSNGACWILLLSSSYCPVILADIHVFVYLRSRLLLL